ncbi:MAG: hypothetical protein IJM21_02350 [Clostridia bacterium]|nr:hypothetical protein [Clostridia bacterium]
MKKRNPRAAVKKLRAAALLTAMLLSLFAACNGNPGNGENRARRVNVFKSGASYAGRVVDLGLAEDEKPLDILAEENGYRLLVGKSISSDMPFPQEDGTTLFFRSGTILQTEYRFLKEDFSPAKKKAVPTDGFMISAERIDGVLYEFRGTPHIENPDDEDVERYAEFLDGTLCADGKELWIVSTNRDDPPAGFFLAQGPTTVASDGKAVYQYLVNKQKVYTDGKLIPPAENIPIGYGVESETPRSVCGIMRLGDTVYALLHDTGSRSLLVPLSPDMKKIEKKGIELKAGASGPCASDGEIGLFFSGTVLYVTDGKGCRKLADLARYGFTSATVIGRILPLSDGRILVLGEEHLVLLSPGEEEEEKPVITLGTIKEYGRDLAQKVLRYNRMSDKYAITIKKFDTPEDLNKALLSGEVALIASSDRLLLRNYAGKGLLLDLEEGMPALFEDGVLYKSLVDTARVGGKSYFLPRTFWLYGYKIKENLYPESGFRTMEDFFGFIDEKDPETKKRTERTIAFEFYGLRRLDEWIDWGAGTCRFVDGDFEKVLNYCGSCPTQEEVDTYTNAHSDVYSQMSMTTFSRGVASDDYDEGGNRYVYFWLPSRVHQGPEVYTPYFLGIVKNEKYEEAAKDFMDFVFLTDLAEGADEGSTGGTCLIKNGEKTEEIEGYSINVKENGAILESYGQKSGSESRALTEEWIGKADQFVYIASEINEVLTSEANRFFAGEITAEKAAEYIQNRVSIYLAELG